jgi:hypothetical protein
VNDNKDEDGIPIAYTALQPGTPVLTATGQPFGRVEHVLQIPAEDLFDGIVITTSAGLRFVDRDQISQITTRAVHCTLTDNQAATLPAPDAPPTYTTDHTSTLHDRFSRLFKRPHWKRET